MKKFIYLRDGVEVYSPQTRFFHWLTVALVAIQIPLGLLMVDRGVERNIWDSMTNFMYSSHKLLGALIFLVAIIRIVIRSVYGVPDVESTLGPSEIAARKWGHVGLYVSLLFVAGLGYAGIVYYPAMDVFNFFLPGPSVAADEAFANQLFEWHLWVAYIFIALVLGHVGITIYHYRIRRDQVLGRMWPRFIRTEAGKRGKFPHP